MKYLVLAVCFGSAFARPDGAGGHHAHHSAPAAPSGGGGYQEPQASYAADVSSGYEQPSAPSGYEQPAYETGYETSGYSSGYGVAEEPADGGLDISMLIIPVLIIAGLALLFPSVTTVQVRRKRSTEEEVSGNSLSERLQNVYMSVLESEECMERIACEVGGMVSDAGINKNIFSAAEPFVPTKYSKMMKKFAVSKDCHKIKCGSVF